ncbi:cuticle protein 6-like [Zophobas morio]|uniref:cuticle protein 6-like n=1 Tax=Zophobas morio TaxID=2755281 RepID=UPI003082C8CC
MKLFLVAAILIAAAAAKPTGDQHVAVTQDTAGNYKLALNLDGHSRVEHGNADGTVSGSYSYVDPNGVLQTVEYTAGVDGFRVTGNNLPVAPAAIPDTDDVAAAKAMHLVLLQQGLPHFA